MADKKPKARKGIIFWLGFGLGGVLVAIAAWYSVMAFRSSHNPEFVALALIPTTLFLIALILSLISKKAGAIAYGLLFALVLASSIVQGTYWVLYIIPAWLFLSGALITISIWE